MRFMEVCGTHTVSLFQSGLRSLLPSNVFHISGPGCPVCVTHDRDVALMLALARIPQIIIATFGDLMRVPGPGGLSLRHMQAAGAAIEIVYSPLDALALARKNPRRQTVFLGIGFETTAPLSACAARMALEQGMDNFSILSLHKLVGPALASLLAEPDCGIDALLLPGHVCTVAGLQAFEPLLLKYGRPGVAAGFEPADMAAGLCLLADMLQAGVAGAANAYGRAVAPGGNPRARELMLEVFEPCDADWRGLGRIAASGLVLRPAYAGLDAVRRFAPDPGPHALEPGCRCGEVLKGRIRPDACPLFGRDCTPGAPRGPCMVASEGSCAAHYRYGKS